MKFGKDLASKMVQEWQDAYMDYNYLKKILKDMLNAPSFSGHEARKSQPNTKLTMYRAFSGPTSRYHSQQKNDDAVIDVSPVQHGGDQYYQTKFLSSSEDFGKKELSFFKKLDDEFNKVLRFYTTKVKDVKLEAEKLSRQMDALIALRVKVEKPNVEVKDNQEVKVPSANEENREADMIKEDISMEEQMKADNTCKPASVGVLDHVKINVDPDTPASTLRIFISSSKADLSFSKEEFRKAKEKLKRAFVNFYQNLQLLKSYRVLNMLAFSKIMKKYDKVTARNASRTYLQMVDSSYLGSSKEVTKLIERLEAKFIKHFANGNRREGMKTLWARDKKERHRTTFFIGVFTGSSVALIAGIAASIHARNLLHHEGRGQYMENTFPLYSLFAFIFLHMFVYGANTYFWRRFRVNYTFILGFKPGTELGFREILLLASGLSVLALAAVLANLDMEMDPETQSSQMLTKLAPLGLVTVLLLITFCPLNIMYRSSRFFLVRSAWRCICAPFYKVTFIDFFLADQLTSQVQAFRNVQFYICYYGLGDLRRRSNGCLDSNVYEILYVVVAIIPFWWRALQCLRRLIDEKNMKQGLNCLKYSSTVVARVMRTMYVLRRGTFWRIMAASTSGVTTIYSTYWDLVMDWGLLQRNARNAWLRDKLLISNKAIYFVAMALNILLRLVWMHSVLDFNEASFIDRRAMTVIVGCLEIIRRGIWNFFRLENEHFHNASIYLASKPVQLPFHYEDEKIMSQNIAPSFSTHISQGD